MKKMVLALAFMTIGMIGGIWVSGGFQVEEVMTGADQVTPEMIADMESDLELMSYWDLKSVFLLFVSICLLIFVGLWYSGIVKFEQDAEARNYKARGSHAKMTKASRNESAEMEAIKKERKWKHDLKDWENRLKH